MGWNPLYKSIEINILLNTTWFFLRTVYQTFNAKKYVASQLECRSQMIYIWDPVFVYQHGQLKFH